MSRLANAARELPDVSDVPLPPEAYVWAGKLILGAFFSRYRVHVSGAERVPRRGRLILACNHMGYLDGPLVFWRTPRRVHTLVKESMFDSSLGFGLRKVGQIRVDRYHPDPLAVKQCLGLLERDGVVSVFPEGARGRGDAAAIQGGAAYLALVTGAPVLPVACLGTRADGASTESMPPRGTRFDVVFGDLMQFDRIPWPRTRDRVAAVTETVREVLAAHVHAACELTGQTLPAPPPAGTSGPDEP